MVVASPLLQMLLAREWSTNGAVDGTFMLAAGEMEMVVRELAVVGKRCGGGCRGGWKERRKLGLGFWEMKMMTWQNLIG
ncbi:hypothetical protein DEO72_LG8g2140 [Vigna unguiculata]|uniref:Uncharacterized protein n=1 Tax=Vigna unguiculata TaxID=3917 RepID=A0A4D6MW30_VIGUN|nr:hypothetical protein DEO72_LG8g2140 [Vigna unguiculata]